MGLIFHLNFFSNSPPFPPTPKKPPKSVLFSTPNSSLSFGPRDLGLVLFCLSYRGLQKYDPFISNFWGESLKKLILIFFHEKRLFLVKICYFSPYIFLVNNVEDKNRSYFYNNINYEKNETNPMSLGQKLKEELAFEVEKARFSGGTILWIFSLWIVMKLTNKNIIPRVFWITLGRNIFSRDLWYFKESFKTIKKFL